MKYKNSQKSKQRGREKRERIRKYIRGDGSKIKDQINE